MNSDPNSSAMSTALQSLVRSIVIGVTAALVGRGLLTQDMAEIYAASVPPIIMAAWGVWSAYRTEHRTIKRTTEAVQAGVQAERDGRLGTLPSENISQDHAQAIIQAVKEEKQ